MPSSTLFLPATMYGGGHDSSALTPTTMASKTSFSIRKFISQHRSRGLLDDGFLFPSSQEDVTRPSSRLSCESRTKGTGKDDMRIGPITPHSSKSSLSSIDFNNADLTNPRPAPPRPGAPLCTSLGSVTSKKALSSSTSLDGDEAENRKGRIDPSTVPAEFEVHLLSFDQEQQSLVRPNKANSLQDFSRQTEEAFRLDIPLDEAQLSEFCAKTEQVQSSRPNIASSARRSTRATPLLTRSPRSSTSIYRSKRPTSKKAKRRTKPITRQANAWTENAKGFRDQLNYLIFHRIEVDEVLSPEKLREIRTSKPVRANVSKEILGIPGTGIIETFTEDDVPTRIGATAVNLSPPSPLEENAATPKLPRLDQRYFGWKRSDSAILGDDDYVSPLDDDVEIILIQGTEPDTLTLQPMSLMAPMNTQKAPKAVMAAIPELTVTTPNLSVTSPTMAHLRPRPDFIPPRPPSQDDDFFFLPSTAYSLNTPGIKHGRIRLAKADITHLQPSATMDDTLDWTAFQMAISGGAGDMFGESTDFGEPAYDDLDDAEYLAAWFEGFGFPNAGALVTVRPAEDHVYRPGHSRKPSSPDVTGPRSADSRDGFVPADWKRLPSRHVARSNSPPRTHVAGEGLSVPRQPVAKRHSSGYVTGGAVQSPPPQLSLFPRPHHSPNRRGTETSEAAMAERKRVAKKDLLNIDAALASRTRERTHDNEHARPRASWDSHTSVDSLPQSPMMDLVLSKDVDGNEYMVSMGYNLSHDLGDYLQWETYHVLGTGL